MTKIYPTEALLISGMARLLEPFDCCDLPCFARGVLRRAGISPADIDAFMPTAMSWARQARDVRAKRRG
jgi:hypothetical protein